MHSFHDMPATRASRVRLPRNNISHQLSQWVSRSVMFLDLSSYQLGSYITSCGIMNQFWDLSNRFFGHFGASFGRLCAKISNDPNLNLFHKAPKNGLKSHFGLLEQSNLFLGALCQNWGWPKSQNWFQKSGWDFCKTIQRWYRGRTCPGVPRDVLWATPAASYLGGLRPPGQAPPVLSWHCVVRRPALIYAW